MHYPDKEALISATIAGVFDPTGDRGRGRRGSRSRAGSCRVQAHHRDRDAAASRERGSGSCSRCSASRRRPRRFAGRHRRRWTTSRLRARSRSSSSPTASEIRCAPQEAARIPARDRVCGHAPAASPTYPMTPHEIVTLCCSTAIPRTRRGGPVCSGAYSVLIMAPFHSQLALVRAAPARQHDRVAVPAEHATSTSSSKGVATGDTTYVLVRGGMMLAIAAAQIACSFCAVYIGARVAMAYQVATCARGSFITSASCRRARSASSARRR